VVGVSVEKTGADRHAVNPAIKKTANNSRHNLTEGYKAALLFARIKQKAIEISFLGSPFPPSSRTGYRIREHDHRSSVTGFASGLLTYCPT
jgi:hypothetical protein